jgi:tetratricopeptide (TPR) repeat protein
MNSNEITKKIQEGQARLESQEFQKAIVLFDEVLKIDPDNEDAFYFKGNAQLNLGYFDDAIKNFDHALELNPDDLDAHNDRGVAYLSLGEFKKAMGCFDDALKINSNAINPLLNKGFIFIELQQFENAIQSFDTVLKLEHEHTSAFFNKGDALYKLNNFKSSLECFNKLLVIDHEDAEAWNYKGAILEDLEDPNEALNCYNKSIELKPDFVLPWYNKGIIYKDEDNLEKSLECFEKILNIEPNYSEAYLEIGNVLKRLGNKDESYESYEKFVENVRKNKFSELYVKARRVSGYLNWAKETGETVTFSPRDDPQYWQWVTKAAFFLDDNGSEREALEPGSSHDPGRWWTCHKDTRAGDLAFIYRAGEENGVVYRDLKYLIMARSDAYPLDSIETVGERNWHYGCDFLPVFKFDNSLKIKEMRADPYLDEWNALRKRFQGIAFRTQESIWKHLNDVLSSKNPDYKKFLKSFDRGRIMAKIIDELRIEKELSDNFHIMKDFGYELEFDSRQKACVGDGGFIDILAKDKNINEYTVIELKVVRADRCTFGQISGYIGWVMENMAKGESVKGIVISRGYDNKFSSALKTNPNIDHIELTEILPRLGMKLK